MARKNATVTDAKANAEKVSTDATVAAEAPRKNDAKRKRTEEAPQAPVSNKGPATKKAKIETDNDDVVNHLIVRNFANSIHITNLSTETTKENLIQHFSDVATPVHVFIFNKRSFFGKPGFCSGQIEFSSPQNAAKALKKDKTELNGSTIEVKAARPPPPPTPYQSLRVYNLEPSVTREEFSSALANWAEHITKVKVPLKDGGEANRGYATVRFDGVAAATDVFTNFKTPIKGLVPRFFYQKANPLLEKHNEKLKAKSLKRKELNAKIAAKKALTAQHKREAAKLAAKKVMERNQKIAKAAKAAKAVQHAKAVKAAQALKLAKAQEEAKKLKAAAAAKVAKAQAAAKATKTAQAAKTAKA